MPFTREQKVKLVEELKQALENTEVVILTDFRGLSVSEQQELRRKLREASAEYRVAKNTLLRLALENLQRPVPEELLTGPTALTLIRDDIAGPTKTLLDFAKEHETLAVKGGLLGDRAIGKEEVEDLAELPPKEVLLAQFIGALQGPAASLVQTLEAPASELVRTLQAPMRELALTLQAYADSQQ